MANHGGGGGGDSSLSCEDRQVVEMLESYGLLDSNLTNLKLGGGDPNCLLNGNMTSSGGSDDMNFIGGHQQHDDLFMFETGRDIYAYITPVIVIIGLVGNVISLKVFTSKVMRRLSSSYYLVCLSASDIIVLMTYVLFDWLNKGLPRWPGNHRVQVVHVNGVCQAFLYLSYTSRFISSWLIVIFTVERFIGVCKPLQRKKLCTKGLAKKMIMAVVFFGCLLCLYKPILSGVYRTSDEAVCGRNRDYDEVNFGLDAFYGIVITAVPSITIAGFNIPILRKLISRNSENKRLRLVLKESKIRLEFTIILIAISTCFICLNLPYFVIWCIQFRQSMNPQGPTVADRISGQLYITRTIFYINYCINFFLYCLTGAYYRREIGLMCRGRSEQRSYPVRLQNDNGSHITTTKDTRYTLCTLM